MLPKSNPNLSINTGTVERHDSSTSSPESPGKGKGKPRPSSPQGLLSGLAGSSKMEGHSQSPRTVARRLAKTAEADPFSTVKLSLGPKSGSHPDVSFEKGGGFLVTTEKTRTLTSSEVIAENTRRNEKFEQVLVKNPKAKAPKPVDENTKKTELKGGIEYHPPGGIHSNYPGTVDYEEGGSYVRITHEVPPGEKERFGRNGAFSPTTTVDHKPLKGGPARVINPEPPPNKSDSLPPSPRTAHDIMQAMYTDPEQTMAQFQSGKPYPEIAKALGKAPNQGASEANIASTSSAAAESESKSGGSGSKSIDFE